MKLLVIKIKAYLNACEKSAAQRDIMNMVEKGVLILDESFDYEVVDGLVILKDNQS